MPTPFWEWFAELPQGTASFIGTLTGSSLGLVALLLGALFNASLNRRRDDALRDADRIAVASALHAELVGVRRTLVENAQHLADTPPQNNDGGFVAPQPSTTIFREVLSKIGLLRTDTIRKVMDAYVLTESYLEALILLGGTLRDDMPAGRPLVYLDARHAKSVILLNRARAEVVKEAIDALAPYLK